MPPKTIAPSRPLPTGSALTQLVADWRYHRLNGSDGGGASPKKSPVKAGRKFVVPPGAPWTWVKREKTSAAAVVVNFLNVRLMQSILSVLFPVARIFATSGQGTAQPDTRITAKGTRGWKPCS